MSKSYLCRVPQGSGCGPVCYLLHVNSLCGLLRHCSPHMFADDLCVLSAGAAADLARTCRSVQQDVDAVVKWSHDNASLSSCQLPVDYYHDLHLPHSPPLYPTLARSTLRTVFSCEGRARGYYADLDTGCQAYHFCWHQRLVATDLCANGTLFNEQFQVCDHFYNVRCGSPFEDL